MRHLLVALQMFLLGACQLHAYATNPLLMAEHRWLAVVPVVVSFASTAILVVRARRFWREKWPRRATA